jgi:peptidoglycan/LPS O-acetylase OafA/YrhL
MENRAVLYVGKISYGLYVYHNFMLAIVVHYLLKWTAAPDYRLVAVLATITTFAAAIVSWHLIERPLAQLKNRFTGAPKARNIKATGKREARRPWLQTPPGN